MDTLNGRLKSLAEDLVDHDLTLEQVRCEFEKQFIVAALKRHECNIGRSAQALGIHRNTLRNKVAALEIPLDELRSTVKKGGRDRISRS